MNPGRLASAGLRALRQGDAAGHGWLQPSTLALALAGALQPSIAHADSAPAEVEFDLQMLKSRGLDPSLAEMFRSAPRLPPGRQRVGIVVNGRPRGLVEALIDETGGLLADRAFLRAAGLHLPQPIVALDEEATFDLRDAWPQAVVRAEPNQQRLQLVLPAEAIDEGKEDSIDYQRGGSAALLNYDVSSNATLQRGQYSMSLSGYTETGFNAANWMFRSRQSFSHNAAGSRLQLLDSYAQRSLVKRRQLLQMGEITVTSPLFGGVPLHGLQVLPESALQASETGTRANVEGIANSEARVEIRQGGVLLHSTLVPPGPFNLDGFTPRDTTTDLEVTMYEDGGERRFLVPATSFARATLSRPGTTVAAGLLRNSGLSSGQTHRHLISATRAWRLHQADAVLSGGALLTERYQTAALGLDMALHGRPKAIFNTRVRGSTSAAARGASYEFQMSAQQQGLRLNAGASRRTPGYRDLYEFDLPGAQHRVKWQLSAGAGIATPRLGTLGVSWSPRRTFAGESSSRLSASWSRRFGRSTLSASVDSSHGALGRYGRGDRSAYVSWSLPLDVGAVRATARQRRGAATLGLDISGRTPTNQPWRASAEQTLTAHGRPRVSAGTSVQASQMRVSASMSHSVTSTSLFTHTSGGLVAHRGGLTFTPYKVQDTFGIASLDGHRGVRISADGSTIVTNRKGHAVLPAMRAYVESRVQVDGTSLPRRADLDNGTRTLRVMRGTFSQIAFKVKQTRRAYVRISMDNGEPVSKGMTVLANDQFLTAVVDGGRVFLPDIQPGQQLQMVLPGGGRCDLHLQLPDGPAADAFHEEGTAVCRPTPEATSLH